MKTVYILLIIVLTSSFAEIDDAAETTTTSPTSGNNRNTPRRHITCILICNVLHSECSQQCRLINSRWRKRLCNIGCLAARIGCIIGCQTMSSEEQVRQIERRLWMFQRNRQPRWRWNWINSQRRIVRLEMMYTSNMKRALTIMKKQCFIIEIELKF